MTERSRVGATSFTFVAICLRVRRFGSHVGQVAASSSVTVNTISSDLLRRFVEVGASSTGLGGHRPVTRADIDSDMTHNIPSLGWVLLYVDDVPAATDFYTRAFCLSTRFAHESREYAELETGPAGICEPFAARITSGAARTRGNV